MSDEELVLDNIKTWTGLAVKESIGMIEDRDKMDKVRPGASTPYKRWSKCTMKKIGGKVFART